MTTNDKRDGDQPVSRDRREFLKGAPTAGAGLVLLGPLAGLSAEEAEAAQPRIMQGAQMAQAAQQTQAGGGGIQIKMIAYGGPFATKLNALFAPGQIEAMARTFQGRFAASPYKFGQWAKELIPAADQSWKTVDAAGNVVDLSAKWELSSGGISDPAKEKFAKVLGENLRKAPGSAEPPMPVLFVVSTSGLTTTGDTMVDGAGRKWNGYRVGTGKVSDSETKVEYLLLAMLCPTDAELPI